MPRIRYLKPDFFTDEDLAELPMEARIFFAGLWCHADRAGRLEDRPKYLKAMIFPYDKVDPEKILDLLERPKKSGRPFIQRYSNGSDRHYIQIVSWDHHQKPHHTEKDSEIPDPPEIPPDPLKEIEKGMGMGMGMEKQLNPSTELNNVDLTVKNTLKNNALKPYGEFKNVFLSPDEMDKLTKNLGPEATSQEIENLSRGIESKGYKYKSHYATILNWHRRHLQEQSKKEDKFL
jgi:hypothetical protein